MTGSKSPISGTKTKHDKVTDIGPKITFQFCIKNSHYLSDDLKLK